jgi:mRNA interferase YafQ
MLDLELSTQFKRDLKKITKQQKNRQLLNDIIQKLQNEDKLHQKHKDHNLTGNLDGYRECHITPDWLLLYKIIKNDYVQLLRLSRTGSHAELF